MGRAPLRVCAQPGCPARVPSGYCPTHAAPRRQQETRFQSGGGLYGRPWRRARAAFLALRPWCAACGLLATVVDHIIPHRGDRALFWDETNWQPLCETCHGRKTATETLHGRS